MQRFLKVFTLVLIALAGLIDVVMAYEYLRLSLDNISAQWQLAFLPLIPALILALVALLLTLAIRPFSKWILFSSLLAFGIPLSIAIAIENYFFVR